MKSGTSGLRGRRPIENADSAGRLTPSRPGDEKAGTGSPPAVVCQPPSPRAPLQLVTQYQKRSIAGFLTFTEATSLMLISKDMHRAIQADPLLRLDEISPAFERLGCNGLLGRIQSAEAEISRYHPNGGQPAARLQPAPESKQQPAPPMLTAGAPTASEPGGVAPKPVVQAGPCPCSTCLAREGAGETSRLAKQLHEIETQKAQLTSQLEALEPGMEGVVFHFVAERMKGPRPVRAADAVAQTMVPTKERYGRLHKAIEDGEVEMVRAGLREFLSLSPALMSNSRKVAWLREPGGMCTLEIVGRRCCGTLKVPERRCCEAVAAYVDEIVSSNYLLPSEKMQLCVKLERARPDPHSGAMNVVELDIVRHAIRSSNPAVAASILLGIHNSSADAALKQCLLAAIAASWDGGLATCVDSVSQSLRRYAHRAPEWVDGMVVGLESVKKVWGWGQSRLAVQS